jgi:hypothetical protein
MKFMTKIGMILAAMLALNLSTAVAGEEELADLTLSGKVEKVQEEGKDATYNLVDADGNKIALPAGGEGVNLDDFVGQDVTVKAKGTQAEADGKVTTTVKSITAVEKAEAPKAE